MNLFRIVHLSAVNIQLCWHWSENECLVPIDKHLVGFFLGIVPACVLLSQASVALSYSLLFPRLYLCSFIFILIHGWCILRIYLCTLLHSDCKLYILGVKCLHLTTSMCLQKSQIIFCFLSIVMSLLRWCTFSALLVELILGNTILCKLFSSATVQSSSPRGAERRRNLRHCLQYLGKVPEGLWTYSTVVLSCRILFWNSMM